MSYYFFPSNATHTHTHLPLSYISVEMVGGGNLNPQKEVGQGSSVTNRK